MAGTAVDLGELADFLVFAKKETYAGDGKRIILPDGTKKFEPVARGLWRYEDEYKGRSRFGGRVQVFYENIFLWHMFYHGGMTGQFKSDAGFRKKVYAFLKSALFQGDENNPFRGPAYLKDEDFEYYNNTVEGGLASFKGEEEIWFKSQQAYVLSFAGGFIE